MNHKMNAHFLAEIIALLIFSIYTLIQSSSEFLLYLYCVILPIIEISLLIKFNLYRKHE